MDVSHDFQPVSSSSNEYTAGLNLSWNVFDSGVTQAAVDTAETAREVAGLTLQKDKEDVDLAVRQSYYNMKEAEKRFVSTQDAVKEAQEDYYIAREKYRAGEGLMLDIIDAQLALSTAQLNFISAQYDYARYKAAIENNIGLGIGESIDVVFGSNISKSNMHTVRATVQEEAAAVVLASGNEVTQ